MSDLEKRAKARLKSIRAEIKKPGSPDFTPVSAGDLEIFTPSENIGRLEFLRSMAYPELKKGLRIDKETVKISFRSVSQKPVLKDND